MRRLPQSPRVKRVVQYAFEEVRNLDLSYAGSEALLLGLLREKDNTAAQVLSRFDLNLENVRPALVAFLGPIRHKFGS